MGDNLFYMHRSAYGSLPLKKIFDMRHIRGEIPSKRLKGKAVTELEDSRIIDLFFERSEQAITELQKKYGALCRRVAGNILRNDLDVEECVNDAYLGAWNAIPPHRPELLSAFICRIVRNLSVTRYHANTAAKRNSFYDAALDELEECIPSAASVEAEMDARELSALLNRFLGTLDRENRILFVRRYWYSDSVSVIGAALHMNGNSVSARLLRIRRKLRRFLEEEGYEL